ncbi:hypothetical protein NNRS527_00350 [Nitrosospira sp. NRS527]|nr:hypothetical protein NNRS527_00350 [Nitrosospira sp. NRS527]
MHSKTGFTLGLKNAGASRQEKLAAAKASLPTAPGFWKSLVFLNFFMSHSGYVCV